MLKGIKLPTIDKEEAKKTALKRLGEYAIFMPMVIVGVYYLFVEELIRSTSHSVAKEVVDSSFVKEKKQLKILMNFIKLQDPDAFSKAQKLEEEQS